MPPKGKQEAWTDEAKLEFVTKFFFTQVSGKFDWKVAPIPQDRTRYGCEHLMRNLKAKYVTGESDKASGSETGATSKAKGDQAKDDKQASKKRKLEKSEQAEDDSCLKVEEAI